MWTLSNSSDNTVRKCFAEFFQLILAPEEVKSLARVKMQMLFMILAARANHRNVQPVCETSLEKNSAARNYDHLIIFILGFDQFASKVGNDETRSADFRLDRVIYLTYTLRLVDPHRQVAGI